MKNYVLFALLGILISFASCTKEDITPALTNDAADDSFLFSKDVTLTDASGENTAVMRIHSDSEAELAAYTSRNFDLVPVMEGQLTKDALLAAGIMEEGPTGEEADLAEDNENDVNRKANTAFEVISTQFAPAVRSYAIQFKAPESLSRSWSSNWHYGEINVDETISITRTSSWHRVYFGMSYKATSSSSYSTIISNWRKLSNNETVTRTRSNCYKLRIHTKYKKSSHYTVEFTH